MMAQDNTRDKDVVTYRAFSGLRNDVDPERFELTDLELAVNVDLDKSGRLARRAGQTEVVAGATHSLWANDRETTALYVQAGTLKALNADYSARAVAAGLTPNMYMSYTEVGDRVYFSNGVQTGVFENGVVRSWGLPVPPIASAQITVGALPAGKYQYVVTYFRADGQESGAGIATEIDVPAGSGLVFALPVSSNPGVATKAVYLSTPNGEVLYLALLVANATVTATYKNDTTELNTALLTQFLQPPPAGQIVGYYRGHTFVAAGDLLYPSIGFGYELFDLRKFIPTDGRITLIAPMEDKEIHESEGRNSGFFLGTDRSCGILVGSDPDNFQYVPKTTYGAIEGAVDYVDGSLFGDNSTGARSLPLWLTTQGLCVGMPGLEIKNLTRTKYGFPAAGRGAALFQPGPNRYIATSNF